MRDRLLLKYHGAPDDLLREFSEVMTTRAPETAVHILAPGEPLQATTSDMHTVEVDITQEQP